MIFISSTIHSKWNRQFNLKLADLLIKNGIECYLAQRDTNQSASSEKRFRQNIKALSESKKVLIIARNMTPNVGVEAGVAFCLKKETIALSEKNQSIPIMISVPLKKILRVKNLKKINEYINQLVNILK